MTTYGVTAASGQLGRLAVRALLGKGVQAADVVAIARTPAKAEDLRALGVTVREGDYDKPETLAAALAGVDRLLLVSGDVPGKRLQGHKNVVDAAKRAGVGRLAYTSVLRADSSELSLAVDHLATEDHIRDSGLPYVFLRNGWYTENYTDKIDTALKHGVVVGATANRPVSAAPRADYAEAAAAALTGAAANTVHELGGAPFTMTEFADALTELTGTRVAYRDVTVEEYASVLAEAGLPEAVAGLVASFDAAQARGELYTQSTDLADLLGRAPTPLKEAIRATL
ncbi:SDR family oxidoreductase [Actinocorallia sp. API 0066]|uniref:SDR family oxidoreductase n=1 Tax=Actinocorallia sp. API 0066 TaxID=2896846 RepID=UPI001E36B465|nr:SDR family oxidoreductase [Actinocorallia sp. API 0066]MCD0450232.1 SDR family oxidoreductase [Actinocorallia sp. API 0066]